ncbi:hypothetical protein KFZ56_15430 [Virgibacillus sp. NKC19-3]|uniref:hypothetical protein n=1 Tax=Virgibacillus saliphilus TaxID=2831674 RepID=UPI001C9A6973|nr:hypothetical protein [Virgibacillus sp. NKC19-3]MBY7144415.1 hypothetical protein [Virgibacillus sp. NKC19-3]
MVKQPSDFYDKFGLNHSNNVADLYDVRANKDSIGFVIDDKIWSSIIPIWKMKEGNMFELTLYPIDLGMKQPRSQRGWPKLSSRNTTLMYLRELSLPFGTSIQIADGVGKVQL